MVRIVRRWQCRREGAVVGSIIPPGQAREPRLTWLEAKKQLILDENGLWAIRARGNARFSGLAIGLSSVEPLEPVAKVPAHWVGVHVERD